MEIRVGDKFIYYGCDGLDYSFVVDSINDSRPQDEKYAVTYSEPEGTYPDFCGDDFFENCKNSIKYVGNVNNEPDPENTIKELQAKLLRYDYLLDELGPTKIRAEVAEQRVKDLMDRLRNTQCKRGDFLERLCEVLGIAKMPPFWDEAEEAVLKAIMEIKGEQ